MPKTSESITLSLYDARAILAPILDPEIIYVPTSKAKLAAMCVEFARQNDDDSAAETASGNHDKARDFFSTALALRTVARLLGRKRVK